MPVLPPYSNDPNPPGYGAPDAPLIVPPRPSRGANAPPSYSRHIPSEIHLAQELEASLHRDLSNWSVIAAEKRGSVVYIRCVGFGKCPHAAIMETIMTRDLHIVDPSRVYLGVYLTGESFLFGSDCLDDRHGVSLRPLSEETLRARSADGQSFEGAPPGAEPTEILVAKQFFSKSSRNFFKSGNTSAPGLAQAGRVAERVVGVPARMVAKGLAGVFSFGEYDSSWQHPNLYQRVDRATVAMGSTAAGRARTPSAGNVFLPWR